jgi:hypothetical protein
LGSDCQETKTAGPACSLANNDPAGADIRFHDRFIARKAFGVKTGLPGLYARKHSSQLRMNFALAFFARQKLTYETICLSFHLPCISYKITSKRRDFVQMQWAN